MGGGSIDMRKGRGERGEKRSRNDRIRVFKEEKECSEIGVISVNTEWNLNSEGFFLLKNWH